MKRSNRFLYDQDAFPIRGKCEDARKTMARYFSWGGRDKEEDTQLFKSYPGGVVISEADLCVMARAVGISKSGKIIFLPETNNELGTCNAWMIHFMAGDLSVLPLHVPEYKKYTFACYMRGGRLDARVRVIPIRRFVTKFEPFSDGEKSPINKKTTHN